MDLATKLFSLSFGVEPNKATLKDLSEIFNSAVLSLTEKQKALSDYAENVAPQTYVAPLGQAPQLKQERPTKPRVKWEIPEDKLKELLWKRAQLIQLERARLAREKIAQANGSAPEKIGRGPPPKLGKSKGMLRNRPQTDNGFKATAPQGKSPQKNKSVVKTILAKSSGENPTQANSTQPKTSAEQTRKAPETLKAKLGQRQVAKPMALNPKKLLVQSFPEKRPNGKAASPLK